MKAKKIFSLLRKEYPKFKLLIKNEKKLAQKEIRARKIRFNGFLGSKQFKGYMKYAIYGGQINATSGIFVVIKVRNVKTINPKHKIIMWYYEEKKLNLFYYTYNFCWWGIKLGIY